MNTITHEQVEALRSRWKERSDRKSRLAKEFARNDDFDNANRMSDEAGATLLCLMDLETEIRAEDQQ